MPSSTEYDDINRQGTVHICPKSPPNIEIKTGNFLSMVYPSNGLCILYKDVKDLSSLYDPKNKNCKYCDKRLIISL